MKEPISVDKDKILSILRDRKSQKMAVVTIATASALIFSIMNYQGLTLPNNTDKIKNAAVDVFKTGKIGDENKDTQSQPSENREDEKEKVSTASQTSTQSQPSTSNANANSNPNVQSSSSNQSQSAPAAATTQPQTQISQDSAPKEQQSNAQPKESSQPEKPAESKPKPRVNAEDMNKSSKPSNWDGKTEVKEGEIEKEWNEEDEVEEIKTR